jgi:hypothetical protein
MYPIFIGVDGWALVGFACPTANEVKHKGPIAIHKMKDANFR